MILRYLAFLLVVLCFCSPLCAQQPNILLYILDDVGVDAFPNYKPLNATKASMPNVDALMQKGITFENTWVNPLCAPTRATILTGKYGFRTNVVNVTTASTLDPNEVIIHEYLDSVSQNAYASTLIGKWHLSGGQNNDPTYPELCGVPNFAGNLGGAISSYTNWDLTQNNQTATSSDYVTTVYTDLAIAWINNQTKPWFCWLAHNAPHTPLHVPPSHMHSQGNLPTDQASIDANPLPYFLAMVESTDYELGRLMASIPSATLDNTIIIVIGDNGALRSVIQTPFQGYQAKGSLYQGSINVPMVIGGKGITRTNARETALINGTDLFATIIEMTNHSLPEYQDSKSFFPLLSNAGPSIRTCAFSQGEATMQRPTGWATRDTEFKLISYETGENEFYNVLDDPYEKTNLLDGNLNASQQAAFNQLKTCDPQLSTSTNTLSESEKIKVYPNPASSVLTVFNPKNKTERYEIVDILGKTRLSSFLQLGENQVNIQGFESGVYYLRARDNLEVFVVEN